MEISWERLFTALGIAIAGIGGMIPIFNAVAAQWNARKAREQEERGQGLEERKYDDSQWKELAAVRKVDLEEARARIIALEQSLEAERRRNDDLTDHIEGLFDKIAPSRRGDTEQGRQDHQSKDRSGQRLYRGRKTKGEEREIEV